MLAMMAIWMMVMVVQLTAQFRVVSCVLRMFWHLISDLFVLILSPFR